MEKKNYGTEGNLNLKLIIAIARTTQFIKKGEGNKISDASLTIPQFSVLELLYHKGDLRICDIIEKTLSSGGNMTVVVANLEKTGLVERYKDPEDGRASLISLTDEGYEKISMLFPEHVEVINGLFGNLNMDEKKRLLKLLKKMTGRS